MIQQGRPRKTIDRVRREQVRPRGAIDRVRREQVRPRETIDRVRREHGRPRKPIDRVRREHVRPRETIDRVRREQVRPRKAIDHLTFQRGLSCPCEECGMKQIKGAIRSGRGSEVHFATTPSKTLRRIIWWKTQNDPT